MFEQLAFALTKFCSAIRKLFKLCYQILQGKPVFQWYRDKGDKTLRLDYDLNENSIVFDLGGYQGQWASDIFAKYCCTIHIFEPVLDYAEKIQRRFARNPKIYVYQHGLAGENRTERIAICENSSSVFKQSNQVATIRLVKATEFMKNKNIRDIDLMKINIEGGEYELLEYLIRSGIVKRVLNIQVQFHDFIPKAEVLMRKIQEELSKTHFLTYQYKFVWENWHRKG